MPNSQDNPPPPDEAPAWYDGADRLVDADAAESRFLAASRRGGVQASHPSNQAPRRSDTFAYPPLEAMDLEALGISAHTATREAHTAIQQLHWFSHRANLWWALLETHGAITKQAEAIDTLAADRPELEWVRKTTTWSGWSGEAVRMRAPDGRLTAEFLQWYMEYCTYDDASGLREYSADKLARGDYPDEGEDTEPVADADADSAESSGNTQTRRRRGRGLAAHNDALYKIILAQLSTRNGAGKPEVYWSEFCNWCSPDNGDIAFTLGALQLEEKLTLRLNSGDVVKGRWRELGASDAETRPIEINPKKYKKYFYQARREWRERNEGIPE